MKKIFLLGTLISSIHYCQAQHVDSAETQNYKHVHSPVQENQASDSNEWNSEDISLTNQKTHKKNSKKYIIIPTDNFPCINVQGKKTKRNYKSQFN